MVSFKPNMPITKLKVAISKPNKRDKLIDATSTRWINRETSMPFKPSVDIMPNIKTKPSNPENNKPATREAEIENNATCVKVSNETANKAPTKIIKNGFLVFVAILFAKKLFMPTGGNSWLGFFSIL